MNAGNVGFHLPPVGKDELLRRVVHSGPLPLALSGCSGARAGAGDYVSAQDGARKT